MIEGDDLRRRWESQAGGPNEAQVQDRQDVAACIARVEQRLTLPPMGSLYVARFRVPARLRAVPIGITMSVAGTWDRLLNALARLDEFVKER
jgi:hypothetical protein